MQIKNYDSRHISENENVSGEPGLQRLSGLAGAGIPSLTGANRAEARCWGSALQRT